jgi:hypothetical protein
VVSITHCTQIFCGCILYTSWHSFVHKDIQLSRNKQLWMMQTDSYKALPFFVHHESYHASVYNHRTAFHSSDVHCPLPYFDLILMHYMSQLLHHAALFTRLPYCRGCSGGYKTCSLLVTYRTWTAFIRWSRGTLHCLPFLHILAMLYARRGYVSVLRRKYVRCISIYHGVAGSHSVH